jgi:hypothetical protein
MYTESMGTNSSYLNFLPREIFSEVRNHRFCHSPSFFTFPAGPSALLALGFASGSHDAPRAGAGKVTVTGHERKYRFATQEPEGSPSGENIYSSFSPLPILLSLSVTCSLPRPNTDAAVVVCSRK